MEVFLLYLLLLALVVYGIVWLRSGGPVGAEAPDVEVTPPSESAESTYARSRDLLAERWRMAGVSPHATRELDLPSWYYEDAESWQIDRIERERLPVEAESLTRGQASDVLGLMVTAGDDEATVLRALDQPVASLSQTAARHRIARLRMDPEQQRRWEALPATPLQREFFRLAGEPVPAGLTAGDARRHITARVERDPALARDWGAFLRLYDDLNVRRPEYHLGPVPASLLGEAVALLCQRGGRKMAQLARTPDLVVDRLLELDPDLELD